MCAPNSALLSGHYPTDMQGGVSRRALDRLQNAQPSQQSESRGSDRSDDRADQPLAA